MTAAVERVTLTDTDHGTQPNRQRSDAITPTTSGVISAHAIPVCIYISAITACPELA